MDGGLPSLHLAKTTNVAHYRKSKAENPEPNPPFIIAGSA